jgi:hypothetical protein
MTSGGGVMLKEEPSYLLTELGVFQILSSHAQRKKKQSRLTFTCEEPNYNV